jgi:predicted ester cyclase
VATRVTVAATHVEEFRGIAPTGERIAITGTVFHRVAGGKLAEGWWSWDTLGLLQQLGAVPAEQPA